MRPLPPVALLLSLLACSADKDDGSMGGGGQTDDTGGGSSGGGSSGGGSSGGGSSGGGSSGGSSGGGGGQDTAEATIPGYRLEATVTWNLAFDEEAEANGFADCAYSRTFEAEQFLDMQYLCPECSVMVRGLSIMTEGEDCYTAVFGDDEDVSERTEVWGLSDDGVLYRANRDQYALGDLTTYSPAEDTDLTITWASDYTMTDGGAMTLSAEGTMRYWVDEELLLDDPWAPRAEPYTCGWPQNDPGTLTLDYSVVAEGETFPNVRLEDQCGELLSLWDLYGHYLVLDTSQPDCGPCQSMASSAETFVEELRAEGIPVYVVSLLGAGLSEPWVSPDAETFDRWVTEFDLKDPVLYDRGFGYAMFPGFVTEFSGEDFGYPTWLLVDPDMTLFYGNVGFGSWDSVAEIIREDWEAR